MLKTIAAASAALAMSLLTTTGAQAADPCHGYDVACDSDGCLVCWPDSTGSVDLICEEASLFEISATLPGCVGSAPQQAFDLVAPQGTRGPVLLGPGGRTVVPEPPTRVPAGALGTRN